VDAASSRTSFEERNVYRGRIRLLVIVNGNDTDLAGGSRVTDLISKLGLSPERLAVEVNRKVIRRANWDSTTLTEGDRVEIVHFVGGGC
jgi:sulfur carrier protein